MASDARERFDELWTKHAGSIYAYAARRVGHVDAEEVVSEVFAVAWRRIENIPSQELPWLYGVAFNVIRQHRRSKMRRERLHQTLVTKSDPVIPTGFNERMAVLEGMDRLDERDQEVLRLVAWEELTPREAAQVLGITASAFRMRLSRARGRLRAELEKSKVVEHED